MRIFKHGVQRNHPKIRRLLDCGCQIEDLRDQLYPLLLRIAQRFLPTALHPMPFGNAKNYRLVERLRQWMPHLAIISQGENFDGVRYAELCRIEGHPYVLISQKASDFIWPQDQVMEVGQRAYEGALACYFVSRHNQLLTEKQIGFSLSRGCVVRNPAMVNNRGVLAWPESETGWRLACVARLWVQDKGQDLLFEVLSQPQWRKRPLSISLVGSGVQERLLRNRALQLALSKVEFLGSSANIEDIWSSHHGLILPSRAEGTPLAAVEAMLCGRPCILTNVGGNADLLGNADCGFLAQEPSVAALGAALEHAWERRQEWRNMGEVAAARAREFIGPEPIERFSALLLQLTS